MQVHVHWAIQNERFICIHFNTPFFWEVKEAFWFGRAHLSFRNTSGRCITEERYVVGFWNLKYGISMKKKIYIYIFPLGRPVVEEWSNFDFRILTVWDFVNKIFGEPLKL